MTPMQKDAIRLARAALMDRMERRARSIDTGRDDDGRIVNINRLEIQQDDDTSALIILDEMLGRITPRDI